MTSAHSALPLILSSAFSVPGLGSWPGWTMPLFHYVVISPISRCGIEHRDVKSGPGEIICSHHAADSGADHDRVGGIREFSSVK